ncbi:MAG: hypothetical protein ABII82_10350, partial [Verrucomicrobiota bacterium]
MPGATPVAQADQRHDQKHGVEKRREGEVGGPVGDDGDGVDGDPGEPVFEVFAHLQELSGDAERGD